QWQDEEWLKKRKDINHHKAPISIYEVHLGSWRRVPEEGNRWLSYRELAPMLAQYVKEMGFTHVEFLPIMEHPFYGSWGYQITGYFAPTSRYGTPQDFMYLIDYLHQQGIGVILDWVPSHFPTDGHGLAYFDGTHLYEYEDWRKGWHPDWNSYIFDYGKGEVRSFLLSSAHFWLEKYHADGLRVDAVASMLYLDYSRKEWVPNQYGGRENLEAIDFLKKLNVCLYRDFEGIQTIAEESTAFPMVSRPVYIGGLGFGFKWNMGWMNDTLFYMSKDPIYRKYHHNQLTFSIWYAFSENFILPLSHDEVVHGKGSLINKMPGDYWQKFANLRLLFGYMWTHPGKKLLFMGGEFAQWREWNHEESLDWHLLDYESHKGIQRLVKDLNRLYREEKALHELDCEPEGFEWIDFHDWEKSIISYLRKSSDGDLVLVVCNFTPVPRFDYRIGVPREGFWKEILNTDSYIYGGSNLGNLGGVYAEDIP
ncbi:MAG: 1,4-alpha-glucan branching protein GlgB, partial [Aquificota bacterium]